MQHSTSLRTLENIYDTYSPVLYSIALEITPTSKEAETILRTTFQKIHDQKLIQQNHPFFCMKLIKLTIQTAREQLALVGQPKNNFKLKQFEKMPLLHKLLCEELSVEQHCTENNLTRTEVAKMIRKEFSLLKI